MTGAEVVIHGRLSHLLFDYVFREQDEFGSGGAIADVALLGELEGRDAGGAGGLDVKDPGVVVG